MGLSRMEKNMGLGIFIVSQDASIKGCSKMIRKSKDLKWMMQSYTWVNMKKTKDMGKAF